MMWRTGNLQSRREFDAYYTWALRARLWVIVTGGGCALVFVLLYGLGPLPATVRVPIWLGVSIVALIGVPFFYLIGVAFVHLIRADRALRREAKDGQVFYPNRIAQWVYVHGLAIGLAVVGLLVTASSWWALHQTR
jgi:hypothetical protein